MVILNPGKWLGTSLFSYTVSSLHSLQSVLDRFWSYNKIHTFNLVWYLITPGSGREPAPGTKANHFVAFRRFRCDLYKDGLNKINFQKTWYAWMSSSPVFKQIIWIKLWTGAYIWRCWWWSWCFNKFYFTSLTCSFLNIDSRSFPIMVFFIFFFLSIYLQDLSDHGSLWFPIPFAL